MSTRSVVALGLGALVLWLMIVAGAIFLVATRSKHLVSSVVGIPSYQGKPLPSGPEAYTSKQYDETRLAYYRKRTSVAYQQFGVHSPAWDKPVADYLEQFSHQAAKVDPIPDAEKLLASARAVAATGCNDPVVLTRVADALQRAGDNKTAEGYFQKATEGFSNSRYPVYCRLGAAVGMARVKGQLGATIEAPNLTWREQAIASLVAASNAQFFEKGEHRVFWNDALWPLMAEDLRRSQAVIINTMKAHPETDPWLFRMAWGQHNHDYAWSKRGGGWISEVKPDDLREFTEGEKYARGNWEKAHALHPEYPEAATALIDVASDSGAGDPRTWFDRAVAAQFDWKPAYYSMANTLLPRWGGSHREMLAFGKECLSTGRFDTFVPLMYSEIVQMISETDRDNSIWQDADVWSSLQTYYDGALAYSTGNRPDDIKPLHTMYIIMAWRCGHEDVARQQLDAAGGEVDRKTFDSQWSERAELVVGQIYAETGPRRDAMKQAELLFQSQRTDQALSAFESLLRDESEKHTRFYVRDRIQTLRWEKQLAAGQWVDLNPTEDLVGWDVWQGAFKPLPDGKGFLVNPDKEAALMMNHIRPGQFCEMTCDVEFPEEKVTGIEAGLIAGVAMVATPYYDAFRIVQDAPRGLCGRGLKASREHALSEVPRKFNMQLLKCDNRYTLRLNDVTVFQDVDTGGEDFRFKGAHNIGIGGESWPNPKKPVIYRNIRIHTISTDAVKMK